MKLLHDFKEFAMRGNVVDMAVGVVIGTAFGKIVSSLVYDIVIPPLRILIGDVNFSDLAIALKAAQADMPAVVLNYGKFIQSIVDFSVIAFTIFMAIRFIN